MNLKEKRKLFHDVFIEWCLKEINNQNRITAGAPIAKDQSPLDRAISISSKIPIVGTAANFMSIGNAVSKNINQYFKTNIEISHLGREEKIKYLSGLALSKLEQFDIQKLEKKEILELVHSVVEKMAFPVKEDDASIVDSVSDGIATDNEPGRKRCRSEEDVEINDNFIPEIDSEWFTENMLKKQINTMQAQIADMQNPQQVYFYNVRQVVASFIGKEEVLTQIHNALSSFERSQIVVIGGIGGIGKTQLTLKYINKYVEEYGYRVRWIEADTISNLHNSYREFARDLGIHAYDADAQNILRLIKRKLGSNIEQSLLVFDNVEDQDLIYSYLPNLSGAKKHHIIITTRNTESYSKVIEDTGATIITVGAFSDGEAVEYIKSYIPDVVEQDALKLASLFSNIPLGLSHSLAYIKKNLGRRNDSVTEYIKQYELTLQKGELPESLQCSPKLGGQHIEHVKNIYSTIKVSLESLSPKAIEILEHCSYLNPDNIPMFLFVNGGEAFSALEGLSLISVMQKTDKNSFIYLHSIVQDIVKTTLNGEDVLRNTMQSVDYSSSKCTKQVNFFLC